MSPGLVLRGLRVLRGGALPVCVAAACAGLAAAQFPHLPRLSLPSGLDDTLAERVLRQEPAITTGLTDAVTDIGYLDGYTPRQPIAMTAVGSNADGVYDLFGGDFSLDAQSYCLHAGAHSPGSGQGYAYAPLRGPGADIVRHVLQHSVRNADIPQQRVQMLLWSILGRVRPSAMSPDLRSAAMRLLDTRELARLESGALDKVPDAVVSRLLPRMPAPVQEAIALDQRVRNLAGRGSATFDDWQRVAVAAGAPVPSPDDRPMPSGRWSYHPDGYFVRYLPSGFSETHIDVSVPQRIAIARDARGRIREVSDAVRRLVISYDDRSDMSLAGGARAVRFASIEYRDAAAETSADAPVLHWTRTGWTLVGEPAAGAPVGSNAAFPQLEAREEVAVRRARGFRDLLARVHARPAPAGRDDLVDVAHLRAAVAAVASSSPQKIAWPVDVDGFLAQAWETAFAARAGVSTPGGDPPFDPSGGAAVPGDTGRQRLGQSGRPYGPQPKCDGSDTSDGFASAVANGMSQAGFGVGLGQVSLNEGGSLPGIEVRTRNGCPLPSMACIDAAAAAGKVPPGTVAGADNLVVGSIEQVNGMTRVFVRVVNVETGVIEAAAKGDASGTGPDAVQRATAAATAALGSKYPLGGSSCQ